jgi:hypothetical protein
MAQLLLESDSYDELTFCATFKGGGYDFPGSNSGVDMFSLTGWLPERIFFPQDPNKVKDFETPTERAWERLYSASSYGDCLITVSTSSDLLKDHAEAIGLVTGHAYAVLSVIQTSNKTRLLQLKNPWAHKVSKPACSFLWIARFMHSRPTSHALTQGLERQVFKS